MANHRAGALGVWSERRPVNQPGQPEVPVGSGRGHSMRRMTRNELEESQAPQGGPRERRWKWRLRVGGVEVRGGLRFSSPSLFWLHGSPRLSCFFSLSSSKRLGSKARRTKAKRSKAAARRTVKPREAKRSKARSTGPVTSSCRSTLPQLS
eukprot:3914755-Rhodomonas_salina.4